MALNYFNYFTEIEERFQKRRGSLLLLSTLDWALIETWREAGIPLEAVLRGIDAAFDKYEARQQRNRVRKVNGLAWCAQAVLESAEELHEAAAGSDDKKQYSATQDFEKEKILSHLSLCADALDDCSLAKESTTEVAAFLRKEIATLVQATTQPDAESLEHKLIALEERLFAALSAAQSLEQSVALKKEAARAMAPYRTRMKAEQIRQVEKQFIQKRIFEAAKLPRLSLFYMQQS